MKRNYHLWLAQEFPEIAHVSPQFVSTLVDTAKKQLSPLFTLVHVLLSLLAIMSTAFAAFHVLVENTFTLALWATLAATGVMLLLIRFVFDDYLMKKCLIKQMQNSFI